MATPFVSLKLHGDPSFAELPLPDPAERVAGLAARACALFPRWRADAAVLELFVVAVGGDEEPPPAACAAAVAGGARLSSRASVTPGAWLVARVADAVPEPPASFEALLARGGVVGARPSVVRRAVTRYGAAVMAALSLGRADAAADIFAAAASLPSLETSRALCLAGLFVDGPLHDGSTLTRCFRDREELVLKPLDGGEEARASALRATLADAAFAALPPIPHLVPFELLTSAAGKRFLLMPLLGATLEAVPLRAGTDDAAVLWACLRDALRGLHARGLAHMDIKPANVCLAARAFVLIDVGSVAPFGEPAATTARYVARDFPGGMRRASARADWWLLAMTLAEKAAGLDVGRAPVPAMAELRARLAAALPADVWAELAEELGGEV